MATERLPIPRIADSHSVTLHRRLDVHAFWALVAMATVVFLFPYSVALAAYYAPPGYTFTPEPIMEQALDLLPWIGCVGLLFSGIIFTLLGYTRTGRQRSILFTFFGFYSTLLAMGWSSYNILYEGGEILWSKDLRETLGNILLSQVCALLEVAFPAILLLWLLDRADWALTRIWG